MKKTGNKGILLEKLNVLSEEGISFIGNTVYPSKKSVKIAKDIIKKCDDKYLSNWEISVITNGTILFYYKTGTGVSASVNAADLGISGFFAFLDRYETRNLKVTEVDKIIEIFKLSYER